MENASAIAAPVIGIETLPVPGTHPATPVAVDRVIPLPPRVPHTGRGRVTRAIALAILRLGGWRVVGAFPDIPRAVLIGAPHSSNWDGVWGFAAKVAMGLDLRILAKQELFWWPMGPILRRLGVIPINRRAPGGFVGHTIDTLRTADAFWIGIAAEGTRKRVEHWKTGFWKIAHAADVPVVLEYFHYPDKIIGIGPAVRLSDDIEADMARIRAWYAPWVGKNRGTL